MNARVGNASILFYPLKSKHAVEFEESKRICSLQTYSELVQRGSGGSYFIKVFFSHLLLHFCSINVPKIPLNYVKYVLVWLSPVIAAMQLSYRSFTPSDAFKFKI